MPASTQRQRLRNPSPRPAQFRPCLEALEDRTLPTAGLLDPTFGVNGMVTADFHSAEDNAWWDIAVQPNDGKIIQAGFTYSDTTGYDFAVVRYNANGTLDTSFGTDPALPGRVTVDFGSPEDFGYGVTVQPDGKILVVGTTYDAAAGRYPFAVARLLPTGALDASFDVAGDNLAAGRVVVAFAGVDASDRWQSRALLQGDKIVVSGGLDGAWGLARLNGDGSVDDTFGTSGDGRIVIPVAGSYSQADAVMQPGGKIVIADTEGRVFRLNSDGSPDGTFNSRVLDFEAYHVTLDDQGNILVGGRDFAWEDWVVARLGADGSVDAGFGEGGVARIDFNNSNHQGAAIPAAQGDGKIILVGPNWGQPTDGGLRFDAARLTADGHLDPSFGQGGRLSPDLDYIAYPAIHPDGGILLSGGVYQPDTGYDFALLRLHGDNSTSLPVPDMPGAYLTLRSPVGTALVDATAVPAPPPEKAPPQAEFPVGAIAFSVTGVAPNPDSSGGTVEVILFIPTGVVINAYLKYDATTDTWDYFAGAAFEDRNGDGTLDVVLTLTDGGSGDADGAANGRIDDPGAPAYVPPEHPVLEVRIDIRQETVNLVNQGVIPVVLFGSSSFDVRQADIASIRLAGAAAVQWSLQDVNGDGHLDWVLHFRTQGTHLRQVYEQLLIDDVDADGVLDSSHQEATVALTGRTLDDEAFEGLDTLDLFLAGKALRDLLSALAEAGAI